MVYYFFCLDVINEGIMYGIQVWCEKSS